MNRTVFDGRFFNDDRMFVTHICRGHVYSTAGLINVSVHHNEDKESYQWCLATYWNTPGYEAYRIDIFPFEADAKDYLRELEPLTPLISNGGNPPKTALSYDEYVVWKKNFGYQDYDYKGLYDGAIVPGSEGEGFFEEVGRNEFIRFHGKKSD